MILDRCSDDFNVVVSPLQLLGAVTCFHGCLDLV